MKEFSLGSNYHIVVGEEDFYIDLLFYHLQLRCFVVIELKTGEFRNALSRNRTTGLPHLDQTLH